MVVLLHVRVETRMVANLCRGFAAPHTKASSPSTATRTPSDILIKRKSCLLSCPFRRPAAARSAMTATAGATTRDFTDQPLLVELDAAEFPFPVPPPTSCGTSNAARDL